MPISSSTKSASAGAFDNERQLLSDRTIGVPSIFISGKSDWGGAVSSLLIDFLRGPAAG